MTDKAAFEAHLATCGECAAELATLTPVAELLKGLDPVEPPGEADAPPPPVPALAGQLHTASDPGTGATGRGTGGQGVGQP